MVDIWLLVIVYNSLSVNEIESYEIEFKLEENKLNRIECELDLISKCKLIELRMNVSKSNVNKSNVIWYENQFIIYEWEYEWILLVMNVVGWWLNIYCYCCICYVIYIVDMLLYVVYWDYLHMCMFSCCLLSV